MEFFPYCLFVSNSQVIGCEDRLWNDLYCVGWGVKLYLIQNSIQSHVCTVLRVILKVILQVGCFTQISIHSTALSFVDAFLHISLPNQL